MRGLPFLACGVVVVVAGSQYWAIKLHNPGHPIHAQVPANTPVRAASMREPHRAVYPHSIIKGGARSAAELTHALAVDPVAAAHYRGFRSSAAHVDRLEHSRKAYVSYRVANAVLWTRQPVTLPEGEAVLTDGENLARVRCGNRISFTPRQPAGPEVDLDTPEVPPPGDEGIHADGMPDVFNLPMIVHNLFPPYFGNGFAAEAAGGAASGPGGSGAVGPEGGGFGGGFGAGGGGRGIPALSPDRVPGVSGPVAPAEQQTIEMASVLPRPNPPVFVWTGVLTAPTGPPGPGSPIGGMPPGSGIPLPTPQGGTLPTGGSNGNGGGDGGSTGSPPITPPGELGAPPEEPGVPFIPEVPQLLPPLFPPPDLGAVPDTDIPEPVTALLFAAGVLALAIRRAAAKVE